MWPGTPDSGADTAGQLPFLGAPPADGVSKVPAGSAYGRLARGPLTSLSAPRLPAGKLPSAAALDAYSSIFSGDTLATYTTQCTTGVGGQGLESTLFSALHPAGSRADDRAAFTVQFAIHTGASGAPELASAGPDGMLEIFHTPEPGYAGPGMLNAMLSQRRYTTLVVRVLHVALRDAACALPPLTMLAACGHAMSIYASGTTGDRTSSWADLLDFRVLRADLCFNHAEAARAAGRENEPLPVGMAEALFLVGEALEAQTQFLVAASVYDECAAFSAESGCVGGTGFCSGSSVASVSHFAAGLAYKRANLLAKAEESNVKGIHHTRTAGDYECWGNLATLHGHLLRGGLIEFEVVAVYSRLLWLVGARDSDQVQQVGEQFEAAVPRGFNARKARQALTAAARCSDVASFRASLLSLRDAGVRAHAAGLRQMCGFAADHDESFKEHTSSDHKGDARKTIRENRGGSVASSRCDNPDCKTHETGTKVTLKLLKCPCHAAAYCQKSCQAAHWKAHKKGCAARKRT